MNDFDVTIIVKANGEVFAEAIDVNNGDQISVSAVGLQVILSILASAKTLLEDLKGNGNDSG